MLHRFAGLSFQLDSGLRRITNHLATVLWLLSGMASSSINDERMEMQR
jgi:hypothetical protein